jgi:6,7-dimethyl-8-ribityllumazine synthase
MKRSKKSSDNAARVRIGVVAAIFNQDITSRLLAACQSELTAQGVPVDAIEVVHVPGAFELPLVAHTMAQSRKFSAVICLGAVIRGDTPHFEYISAEVSRGIGQAALETGVPIIFGVLTTETEAQALERADATKFNRGGAAAQTALEMVRVMRRIREGAGGQPRRASAKRGRNRR